ncbi:MAG: flavodoxin-dependent (E)-4-hydroxy-3-methylbut-2-enyl-diphosphate synthase [Oscillospiraceae bacterium]
MNRTVKKVRCGALTFGGETIYIQSMLNAPPADIAANIAQAKALEAAGCDIVRIAVPDREAIALIPALKEQISMPVVADIHYDWRLAVAACEAGADKIRINPGNIGGADRVKAVVDACGKRGVPIRIGVNAGSLEKDLLAQYGSPCAEALAESAKRHIALLEAADFNDIVISIKSSNVAQMIKAYRIVAAKFDYPLHLGVTEAGTERMGLIKSAIGIGALLADGIGETIRVSLTDEPVKEIYAAKDILKALNLTGGVKIVSCPTCGRTKIDLIGLANRVEEAVKDIDKNLTVAVMGCVVNGIGEAGEVDLGIAGGDGCAVLFKHGKKLRKVTETEALGALLEEIRKA